VCNCVYWPPSNDLCQRGLNFFLYKEHKLFGRHYLGVNRTTMSSAVRTFTQVKACFSIMAVVVPADTAVTVSSDCYCTLEWIIRYMLEICPVCPLPTDLVQHSRL
jgi:hypothetical protein